MGVLLIVFTFSLGIIVSYALFQYNSGKNVSYVHPSLLKLQELEQNSTKKVQPKKKKPVPEFDINGELLPLYHNEEEYNILTNEIRRGRIREITNIMINTTKEILNNEATLEQIMFDLELTGDVEATVSNFIENGGLPIPPENYYIRPISVEDEENLQNPDSDVEEIEGLIDEESEEEEHSVTSDTHQRGIYESIQSMYLNPQNLLKVYNVKLDEDYESGKDSSMKTKAKSMILKARRNMEKLDQSNNLRK